jgi:hypothetical protein
MNEAERHVRETLEDQGFRVSAVPRGETKTADFLVEDAITTYLVEVTGKEEGEFIPALLSRTKQQGVADDTRGIGPSDTLDGIVRRKAMQLANTPVSADFHVLWIAAFHRDWEYLSTMLLRTLYGVAKVASFHALLEERTIHECLYYHRFSFFRDRNLHAVVFSTETRRMLCVNALSARAEEFRRTKLHQLFASPVDPARAPDGVLVVPPDVDRSLPNAQWQYLKDRYGLMTNVVPECDWRGFVSLDA